MSLYVNNAAEQPKEIYYEGNSLNTVYFNGDLVWQRVADYTDWQEMIKTVEDKESGAITEWPQEYIDGCVVNVPLTSSSSFWGGSSIDLHVIALTDTQLAGYVIGGKTTYADLYNLKNYRGYGQSIPRAKCSELYNLLPFKSNIKSITKEIGELDTSKVKIYTNADGTQYFDDAYWYFNPNNVTYTDYVTVAGSISLESVIDGLEVTKTSNYYVGRTLDETEFHWGYTINPGYGDGAFNPENYYYEVVRNADGTIYDITSRDATAADYTDEGRVVAFMKIGA